MCSLPMNGVIVVDKPQGFTSFDVVALMRGLAKERKIGHTGTLDPMATGVLPLLLGKAAKAASLLPDTEKAYQAAFLLGQRFDTGDVTGRLLQTDPTPVPRPLLEQALSGFLGDILQVPPMYSAVSVNGQRLYKLARQGVEVERPARPVHISRLVLESYDETTRQGVLSVSCSQGTYIRTLIEDIAQAAGTLGAMSALRRTQACGFPADAALPLPRLRQLAAENRLAEALLPTAALFQAYPATTVTQGQAVRFCNGGSLDLARLPLPKTALSPGQRFRVLGPAGAFLGLAEAQPATGQLKFLKLFAE